MSSNLVPQIKVVAFDAMNDFPDAYRDSQRAQGSEGTPQVFSHTPGVKGDTNQANIAFGVHTVFRSCVYAKRP
jgi:hypothetical protein